jgi:hypothetical protein
MKDNAVKELKNVLNGNEKLLRDVLTTMIEDASGDKILLLERDLREIKEEIGRINQTRSELSCRLVPLEKLYNVLLSVNADNSCLSLFMLSNMLYNRIVDLKREICDTKPRGKLKKKFELVKSRDAALKRRDLAARLLEEFFGDK